MDTKNPKQLSWLIFNLCLGFFDVLSFYINSKILSIILSIVVESVA